MTTLKTPEQLARAIETLVGCYIDEVRTFAVGAIERSLRRPTPAGKSRRPTVTRGAELQPQTNRRTPEQVGELAEQLEQLICSEPGRSMAALSEQLGQPASLLQRPMTSLAAAGRVRKVGQRNMTRYYPSLASMEQSPGSSATTSPS